MFKKQEHTVNLTIASGQSSNFVRFTPPAGNIIACAIFTNGAANTGFVTAKISNDSGDIISDATDIRNYRDREAGYVEGKKPLYIEATGGTYQLDILSTAAWAADFKCQLVLVYENTHSQSTC
jgi:hypothetical protein